MHTGGSNTQLTRDVGADAAGNRIVVGAYSAGSAVFGTYSLPWTTSSTDPTLSNKNGFIVKISPTNTVLWATRISSIFKSDVNAVSVDGNGNIYVCGGYSGTCSFYNAGSPTTAVQTMPWNATDGRRGYIAKYNSSGILQWAVRGVSQASGEMCADIAVNSAGTELAVCGRLGFGFSPLSLSAGTYVARLNAATGAVTWAYNNSNDGNYSTSDQSYGICFDNSNNIIVGARMNGSSTIVRGASGGSISLTSNATFAATYSKYALSGTILWARAVSASVSATQTYMNSIVTDSDNNIYLGGCVDPKSAVYNLSFQGSPAVSLSIPTTPANQAFIIKILSNGNASPAVMHFKGTGSKESISLIRNPCDVMYASVLAGGSCTFTDASNTSFTETFLSRGASVIKFNKQCNFLLSDSWIAWPVQATFHVAGNNSSKIICAGTTNGTISFPTTGGPVTLTAPVNDVLSAEINDINAIPAPSVILNAPVVICNGNIINLSATVSGTGPFTYTWAVYNIISGTFTTVSTSATPSATIPPSAYQPNIFNYGGVNYVWVSVTVTNCSGSSTTRSIWVEIKDAIQFSQVLNQDVCYSAGPSAPNAIFSTTAVYADSYEWFYSADGGATWITCVGIYPGASTNSLTVNNIIPSMDGYLFRCVMLGICNSTVTLPALLNVVPCPFKLASPNEDEVTEAIIYPNPASASVTLHTETASAENPEQFALFDLAGRVVMTEMVMQTQSQFRLDDLPAGTYVWQLVTKGGTTQQGKLVVTE